MIKSWDPSGMMGLDSDSGYGGDTTTTTMDIVTLTIKFKQDIALLLNLPAASDDGDAQIPNLVLTALTSFDGKSTPIGDFKATPPGVAAGIPPGMNFLYFLSEVLGHEISIACPGKNYSSSDIYLLPPTDNPVANFLAEMMPEMGGGDSGSGSPKLRLFPDAPWKTDTIVAVIPPRPCGGQGGPYGYSGDPYGYSGDPCCYPSHSWSECTISVGATKNVPVASHEPACNIEQLASFKSIVNPFFSKLEEAQTTKEFALQLGALSLIPLIDVIQDCEDLLETMLTKSETPVWVPGVRMCTADSEEAWLEDPCCNPQKAFEQCCPLRDVQKSVTLIDSVLPDQQCDKTVEASLENALMSYSMAYKLRNDPNAGCTAARKKKFSQEQKKQLYQFYTTCNDILFTGKTKAGNMQCNNDDECYTKCQSSSIMSGGPGGKTCSKPYGDYEGPFFECALDNADPMLLNWIRKTMGVSAAEPLSKLKKIVHSKFAEDSCTGDAGANGAVCLLNIPQAQCDDNVFNYAPNAGFYSAPAIFVDRTKSDESTCNSASGRQWYSTPVNVTGWPGGGAGPGGPYGMRMMPETSEPRFSAPAPPQGDLGRRQQRPPDGYSGPPAPEIRSEILGCVCKGSAAPAPDTSDLGRRQQQRNHDEYPSSMMDPDCQSVNLHWYSMETLQQDGSPLLGSWSQPPSLKTEFLQDYGQCRLSAFDANSRWLFDTGKLEGVDVSPARSISEHLCTALGKTVAKVNGWGVDSVTGYYESFNPEYEWIYNDAEGTYKREQTSPGSQHWCEFETGCNHRPWDPTAASQSKCVTDYQTDGPKAAQGASFCAQCDGPWCWEISSPSKCLLNNAYDQSRCEAKHGLWLEENFQCAVDAQPDHTEATCIKDICPKEVFNYYDYMGGLRSYTSFGFCEYMTVCYALPTAVTNKGVCEDAGGEWYMSKEPSRGPFRRRTEIVASSSGSRKTNALRKALGISHRRISQRQVPPVQTRESRKRLDVTVDSHIKVFEGWSGKNRREGTDTCQNDNEWVDSYGDGCREYERDPSWCNSADDYADEDGFDATDKCCLCRFIEGSDSESDSECTDNEVWEDSYGDGCDAYAESPYWCASADMYANEGVDASTACCVCQALDASGIEYADEYENNWQQQECNQTVSCEAGSFCNFDQNGGGLGGDKGWCEPCGWCPNCFACGLPDAGVEACEATCAPDQVALADSETCRFMGFSCNNITHGGWGTDASTVCHPDTAVYKCDGSSVDGVVVGQTAAEACPKTCAAVSGCKWVENNLNVAGELYVGEVASEEACIALVRDECPSADIANMELDGAGACWCQYGDDMTPSPGAGWKSCLLSTVGLEAQRLEVEDSTDNDLPDFEEFDADGNGCISETEFNSVKRDEAIDAEFAPIAEAFGSNGCISKSGYNDAVEIVTMFQEELDYNGDGCLSRPEYAANPAETYTFDDIDMLSGSADECISLDDVFRFVVSMQQSSIDTLFSSTDTDGNGCVTPGEFNQAAGQDGPAFEEVAQWDNNATCISKEDLNQFMNSQQQDITGIGGGTGEFDLVEDEWEEYNNYWSQMFWPKQDMCVFHKEMDYYVAYDGSASDYDTKSKCTEEGYEWLSPRRFEEGRWSTEAACKAGVCSSAPWDWELAKKPGTCENLGGICSRPCKACEPMSYIQELCVNTTIVEMEACYQSEPYMLWNEENKVCYTTDSTSQCFKRADARRVSCRDLGDKGCTKDGWMQDKFYNGSMGLQCYTNNYGRCHDQETCESGGSCNDWTYESWMSYSESRSSDTVSCRVPFETGPYNSTECVSLQGMSVWEDACLVHNMEASACSAAGGTAVQRAETQTECTRFKGCFDENMGFNTAVSQAQCTNRDICDPDQYEWKNVLEWTPGVWYPSKMMPAHWKQRELEKKNVWGKKVSMDSLSMIIENSLSAMAAEAYKTEFMCKNEPLYAVLEKVACACGSGRSSTACDGVLERAQSVPIVTQTLFLTAETQHLTTAVGSVAISSQSIQASVTKRSDNVAVSILATPAFELRNTSSSMGNDRRAAASISCSDFDIIRNSQGQVVGQLIGDGLAVEGLKSGNMTVCLQNTKNIPKCMVKYPVTDFAFGDDTNKPTMPLGITITTDKSDRLCGQVPIKATGKTLVFPIMRTSDLKPYSPYTGAKVTKTMTLSIVSKDLFSLDRAIAFKKSIATSIHGVDVDASSIVITKVCDASGCIDYAKSSSRRRTLTSGVTVSYEIKADAAAVASIQRALSDASFATTFEKSMKDNGYAITWIDKPKPSSPPPPSTSTPTVVLETVPLDKIHVVTLSVTMPYSKAEFDTAKQDNYKSAMADTAGTSASNVYILEIKESPRRAGSVDVQTQIRAKDAAGVQVLANTLGSGDALKTKLNKNLEAKGMKASTGVSNPVVGVVESTPKTNSGLASPPKTNSGLNIGAIIGGCLGGAALVVGIFVYYQCYVTKAKPPTDINADTIATTTYLASSTAPIVHQSPGGFGAQAGLGFGAQPGGFSRV